MPQNCSGLAGCHWLPQMSRHWRSEWIIYVTELTDVLSPHHQSAKFATNVSKKGAHRFLLLVGSSRYEFPSAVGSGVTVVARSGMWVLPSPDLLLSTASTHPGAQIH